MRILAFDTWGDETVAENYYHFCLGYLLPLADHLIAGRDRTNARTQSVICRSCGPLMDRVLTEMLTTLDVRYDLRDRFDPVFQDPRAIPMPRWDMFFARRPWRDALKAGKLDQDRRLLPTQPAPDRTGSYAPTSLQRLRQRLFIRQPAGLVHRRMDRVKRYFLQSVRSKHAGPPSVVAGRRPTLILRRAKPAQNFHQTANPNIKTYGATRRSLANTEEIYTVLTASGRQAMIYEPGSDTWLGQIARFSSCSGVIALRGAEIANTFWMPAGAKVVLANPMAMGPIQRMHIRLFAYAGVDAHVLDVDAQSGHAYRIPEKEVLAAFDGAPE